MRATLLLTIEFLLLAQLPGIICRGFIAFAKVNVTSIVKFKLFNPKKHETRHRSARFSRSFLTCEALPHAYGRESHLTTNLEYIDTFSNLYCIYTARRTVAHTHAACGTTILITNGCCGTRVAAKATATLAPQTPNWINICPSSSRALKRLSFNRRLRFKPVAK